MLGLGIKTFFVMRRVSRALLLFAKFSKRFCTIAFSLSGILSSLFLLFLSTPMPRSSLNLFATSTLDAETILSFEGGLIVIILFCCCFCRLFWAKANKSFIMNCSGDCLSSPLPPPPLPPCSLNSLYFSCHAASAWFLIQNVSHRAFSKIVKNFFFSEGVSRISSSSSSSFSTFRGRGVAAAMVTFLLRFLGGRGESGVSLWREKVEEEEVEGDMP